MITRFARYVSFLLVLVLFVTGCAAKGGNVGEQAPGVPTVVADGGAVDFSQGGAPVDSATPAPQSEVVQDVVDPTAVPTTDPDPLLTAYGAELDKLDSHEELVQNGINPSVPPQKDRVIYTGHGVFNYGDKVVNLTYNTPCDDTQPYSDCRLYIVVLVNEGDPGYAPINFIASMFPEGGTSIWEYRQGATPNLDPLWKLPLREFNHCGYNCGEVVVVTMKGDSTESGDSVEVTAMLYERDGTSRDFTAELHVSDGRPGLPTQSVVTQP